MIENEKLARKKKTHARSIENDCTTKILLVIIFLLKLSTKIHFGPRNKFKQKYCLSKPNFFFFFLIIHKIAVKSEIFLTSHRSYLSLLFDFDNK